MTTPPYFEGVQIGLSHNWCYDYTSTTLGTVPVLRPDRATYANDGKDIQWWYRNGPATYGETWVPVGMNLAPGRAASQSSSYGFETPPGTAVAPWAIDGNTDGTFTNGSVSCTLNDLHAWWQLDLGGLQWIDAAQLWNRTDCCGDRLKDFYVLVTDKAQWPPDVHGWGGQRRAQL